MTGARIPFALVGVLLLVSSATFAGSLQPVATAEPSVDDALDRQEAQTQSALRSALTEAAVEAARNPVTTPASTEFGRVLNDSNTFHDALRLRIYLAARDRLARLDGDHDGVSVTASLPATPTPDRLRTAKRRVSLSRTGPNRTQLRATVENVTLTARRDGDVVGKRSLSPTLTVPVPTLAVHDRVETFEDRLDAGPGKPGLGRRLTGKLYPLVWVRGYAQFAGTPIENVLANRHIALFTNGAVLSMQRAHFGHSDPTGRNALQTGLARTALKDVLGGIDHPATKILSEAQSRSGTDKVPAEMLNGSFTGAGGMPEETVTIGINETADRQYLRTDSNIGPLTRRVYTVDVQRRVRVEELGTTIDWPTRPGDNWTLADNETTTTTIVHNRSATPPEPDGPWHTLRTRSRLVVETDRITRTWQTPNGTRETTECRETRHAVDVLLVGRHDGGDTPDKPVDPVHESGGAIDGQNLAEVRESAISERPALSARRSESNPSSEFKDDERPSHLSRKYKERPLPEVDADSVAKRALTDGERTTNTTFVANRPGGLGRWIARDLSRLNRKVRNVSITVEKSALAMQRVNPAEELSQRLTTKRASLLGAPYQYDGIADRARIAVRKSYLDRVVAALDRQAAAYERQQSETDDRLSDEGGSSLSAIRTAFQNQKPSIGAADDGLQMRVQTAPSYLTLGPVGHDTVPAIPNGTTEHPLVAKNLNLFTVPSGDLADFFSRLLPGGKERTSLRNAAQILRAGEQAGEPKLQKDKLRSKVKAATNYLKLIAVEEFSKRELGDWDSRRAVVDDALSRWDTPATRALAMSNSSGAAEIHHLATERWDLSTRRSQRLKFSLRLAIASALNHSDARPPWKPVNEQTDRLQTATRDALSGTLKTGIANGTKEGIEAATGKSLSTLPAGMPVAPPLAPWVMTVNYWEVQVRGEYARFTVSVPYGTPDTAGARLLYVRDENAVSLDVDGDGSGERLGHTNRVDFRTHTSVAIAVPPKPRGVGDKDGNADERSAGWPRPGP